MSTAAAQETLVLSEDEMVALHSIYLAGDDEKVGMAGAFDTKATKRLLKLGLIENVERSIDFIGKMKATFYFHAVTEYGHQIHEDLGLPLNERDLKFLSRRSGACVDTFPAFQSCKARLLIEELERYGTKMVRWKRVSGKAERWRKTAETD